MSSETTKDQQIIAYLAKMCDKVITPKPGQYGERYDSPYNTGARDFALRVRRIIRDGAPKETR